MFSATDTSLTKRRRNLQTIDLVGNKFISFKN